MARLPTNPEASVVASRAAVLRSLEIKPASSTSRNLAPCSRPPRARASKASSSVQLMLIIPPRPSSPSRFSIPVLPGVFCHRALSAGTSPASWKKIAMPVARSTLADIATSAATLRALSSASKSSGRSVTRGLSAYCEASASRRVSSSLFSGAPAAYPRPKAVKIASASRKVGPVVKSME